jgi:hypothetical protein
MKFHRAAQFMRVPPDLTTAIRLSVYCFHCIHGIVMLKPKVRSGNRREAALWRERPRDASWIVSDFVRAMNEANRVKLAWVSGWSRSRYVNSWHLIPYDQSGFKELNPRRRVSLKLRQNPRRLAPPSRVLASQHRPDAEGLISILKCLKLTIDIIFQCHFIAHLMRSNARDYANSDSGPATTSQANLQIPDPCSFRVLDCSPRSGLRVLYELSIYPSSGRFGGTVQVCEYEICRIVARLSTIGKQKSSAMWFCFWVDIRFSSFGGDTETDT